MAKAKKPQRGPKVCIFCGKRQKMSREHIWGEWLKQYVKQDMNKHAFHAERVGKPGEITSVSTTMRAGDPLHSKVKVVCAKCNNEWLSEIQNAAKPFLVPLIEGKTTTLGKIAQERVAAWCAMATMTAEFIDPDPNAIAVSQEQREWLMNNGTAPDGWRIWIGRYQRHTWVGRWIHVTMPILKSKDIPSTEDGKFRTPNTQVTTFIVGQLYVHVMSSVDADNIAGWRWGYGRAPEAGRLLAPIRPHKESIIVWPPTSLTDRNADTIAAAFYQYVDVVSRSATGRRLF